MKWMMSEMAVSCKLHSDMHGNELRMITGVDVSSVWQWFQKMTFWYTKHELKNDDWDGWTTSFMNEGNKAI